MGIYESGFRTVWRAAAGAGRSPVLLVGGYANDERSVGAITRRTYELVRGALLAQPASR